MTPAERQQLKRDRRKAGLVLVQEWVPAQAEKAVRVAIVDAAKESAAGVMAGHRGASAMKVKPLEWCEPFRRQYKSFHGSVHRAETIIGAYEIWHYEKREGAQFHLHYEGQWHPTLAAAQAAAHTDYAARILSALDITDMPHPFGG